MKKLFAVLILVSLAACKMTTTRQSPEFSKTWNKQYSIAMLPPDVEVTYIQFDGDNKRLPQQEVDAANHLKRNIPFDMREHGYKVVDVDFTKMLEENSEAKFELEKIRNSAGKSLSEIYEGHAPVSPEESVKMEKTVGPGVNLFADYANADILLYSKYQGFEKSDGMIAKDVAATVLLAALTGSVASSPSEGGLLMVALIDGTTGNLLWTNGAATGVALQKTSDPKHKAGEGSIFDGVSPYDILFSELPDKSKPQPAKD